MTRKLAGLVMWSCAVWMAVQAAGAIYFVLSTRGFSDLAVDNLELPIQWFTVSTGQWRGMVALTVAYMSIGFFGTWHLFKAFRSFARGEWFDEQNSRHLRRFASLLLLQGILRPIYLGLASVLLSLNHPPGEKVLSVQVGSHEVSLLIAGFIMWVVADLLVEGTRAANENRQFV